MDLDNLCKVLQGCLSTSREERFAAEDCLQQHEKAPGQVVSLLRVAVEDRVDASVRQVAAISFKNSVRRYWEPNKSKSYTIAEADKVVVRDNLLGSLLRAPHAVQLQLGESLKEIVTIDYPQQWPSLLPGIVQALQSNAGSSVFGGLCALCILMREHQYCDEDKAGELNAIVDAAFPTLLHIFRHINQDTSGSLPLAEAARQLLKIFFYATFIRTPPMLGVEANFIAWMSALHTAAVKDVPQVGLPEDPDQRRKWPHWKAKKWVFRLIYRHLSRFSSLRDLEGADLAFAKLYMDKCMLEFVEAQMGIMARLAKGEYVSPQVVSLALQGLSHAVKVKRTYAALKPHVDDLAANVVFPLMCFNGEDSALWEEDPQEFIRRGYDLLDNPYDVKMSAVNLAHELCMKKKADHLHRFMSFLLQVLHQYQAERQAAAVTVATACRMDGALMAFGTMSNVLLKKKPYKDQLEAMLMQHVAPCLEAPQGHLRAKAFWVTAEFASINFTGNSETSKGANFALLLNAVMQGLKDPELPVRVDAGAALRFFIDELPNGDPLTPILPQLVDGIFALMAEVDSEELVSTLETIIEKVGENIAPYAVELARRLVAAFDKYCQRTEEDDENSFQAEWAAYGCLRALNTLLGNLSELRHVFPPLEEVVFPLMAKLLSEEGQDHLEDVLELLTYFTYLTPTISPQLWSLWPKIHEVTLEWGMDYWEHVLRPLDNYISRSTDVFLSSKSPDYLASVYQMVEATLQCETQESNMLPAVQLLEVVLQHCRGRVDSYIQPYLQLVLAKGPTATKRRLRDALMLVVANVLYYNPALGLAALQSMGVVGAVFQELFQMIQATRPSGLMAHFSSPHEKKMVALALTALLSVPDAQLPPEVRSGLPQIAHAVPKVLKALLKQEADIAQKEDEEEEDDVFDEDDDDDAAGGLLDGGDDIDDDDPGYLERLKKAARKFMGEEGGGDDDSDLEEEFEEDCVFATDEIDAVQAFAEVLRGLQGAEPARYQAVVGGAEGAAMVAALEQLLQEKAAAPTASSL